MAMQKVEMFACESASGKLPILVACDANVVVGGAIFNAQRVAIILVRYGSKVSWDT